MYSRFTKSLHWVVLLACAGVLSLGAAAQSAPKAKAPAADTPSRWDIFAGYSYLAPGGKTSDGQKYSAMNKGVIASVAYYFNDYFGVEAIGDAHGLEKQSKARDMDSEGYSAGLIARYPKKDVTIFGHALVGSNYMGTYNLANRWGAALTIGGGMDFATPLLNHRLSIRLFQADYQYAHENFADILGNPVRGNFKMARLSTGLVYRIGSVAPPAPVTISCAASPSSIFAGEPVSLTATAGNLNPKSHVVYSWAGEGVSGKDDKASVATANLAPGTYTVKCGVKEGKAGKEGLKPWEAAENSTTFVVKAFEPPTVSCSANPTSLKPGESATITATAVSPQNRPLTYSYTASAGSVAGSGNTATFKSAGAPAGATQITCAVSDDKGHTVSANTTVAIVPPPPPPPPAPKTSALCSTSFDKDAKRPTRVDNEAKACLDEVALNLQKAPAAQAVLVGEANAKEQAKTAKQLKVAAKNKRAKVYDSAAERAVNSKAYLVTDKGIDASRISVATGTADAQKVENYIVPAGAVFANDVKGTTPVDEGKNKVEVRKALPVRSHKK